MASAPASGLTPPKSLRCLWADMSQEADEDIRTISTPWEWLSSHTADSFEEDLGSKQYGSSITNMNSNCSSAVTNMSSLCSSSVMQSTESQGVLPPHAADMGSLSGATSISQPPCTDRFSREDGRFWDSASSLEAPSSSAVIGAALHQMSTPLSTPRPVTATSTLDGMLGQGAPPLGNPFTEATIAPARRFRLKNKKLEAPSRSETKDSAQEEPKDVGEWSKGAAAHGIRRCRRCLFYDSPVGCVKGANCDFCHLTHFRSAFTRPSKAKRDRYSRLFQEILERRTKKSMASGSTSTTSG